MYHPKSAYIPSKWGAEFHGRREAEVFGAGAAGPGKALALTTLIPTPTGFKRLKDIHPGDYVFSHIGKPIKVIAETEVFTDRPCNVVKIMSETIVCDDEHQWQRYDGKVMTTHDIRFSKFAFNIAIHINDKRHIEYPVRELPVDPYVFGLCLVRGTPKNRAKVITWDPDIEKGIRYSGYYLRQIGNRGMEIATKADLINQLIPESKRRIPETYATASFNQRMALIEGIMDSNGGQSPFCDFADYGFIRDFYSVAASCGLGPVIHQSHKTGWHSVKLSSKKYNLSRSTIKAKVAYRTCTRVKIKSIKRTNSVPTKCIQVEGDGVFLITRSYIPTHNSMVLLMDPVEQIWVEHARCQQNSAPDNFGPQIKQLIEHNPINWGHSEAWVLHLRRTLPRLSETINRSHRIFKTLDPKAEWNEKNHIWTFSSGLKYEFGHCKDRTDYNNYLGKQYTHLGFDELVEFNKEQYDFICSRLRTGDKVLRHFLKIRAMSNPRLGGNKGEDISIDDPVWVKKYFVDPWPDGRKPIRKKIKRRDGTIEEVYRIYIPATLYDNPDPEFVRDYELKLMSRPKHIRDCYLYGKWDTIMGSHFGDIWIPEVHVCEPFKIPSDWPIFRGGDWAFASQGTIGYYAISPENTIYKFYEMNFRQKTATEVAEMVKWFETKNRLWDPEQGSKVYGPMDNQLWEERGSSAKNKYEEMVEVGVDWCKADKRSRETNCEVFTARLLSHENFTKKPGIVYFKNCLKSIQTIPAMETDHTNLEVPKKGGADHWYDCDTYACQYAKQSGLSAPDYKSKYKVRDEDELDSPRGTWGYWT